MTGATCNNSVPDAPDITVNNTTIEIADDALLFQDESFTIATSTGALGLEFTLTYTPFSSASVNVFKNGSLGKVTTDYTRVGKVITLTSALVAGDTLQVKYVTTDTE